jgi:hypothetical protein
MSPAAWFLLLAVGGCGVGHQCTPDTFSCRGDDNRVNHPHGQLSEICVADPYDVNHTDESAWLVEYCNALGDGSGPFNCQYQRDSVVCWDGFCYCKAGLVTGP